MLSINTNINNLKLQRHLNSVSAKTQLATERMSTGYRINSASDDAAGLVISKALKVQENGLQVANENAQMATNILNVADGALSKMTDLTLRIRDLALQASNGGYSLTERTALQQEVTQLSANIEQLLSGTKFNDFKIFGEQNQIASIATPAPLALDPDTVYVENAQQLYEALNDPNALNNENYKIELTNNIDLNDLGDLDGNGSNWITIGNHTSDDFMGTFDGNGFAIKNLKGHGGLFYAISGATIKNLRLENVNITSTETLSGAIAGDGDGLIENCHVSGVVKSDNSNAIIGGLLGWFGGQILNSSFSGDVIASMAGDSYVGGLFACIHKGTEIRNCYSTGSVQGSSSSGIGGLIGCTDYSEVTISNCYSSSNIIGADNSSYYAGFLGDAPSGLELMNCYSIGQVSSSNGNAFVNDSGVVFAENCHYVTQISGASDYNGTEHSQDWFNNLENIKTILGDDGTWDYSTFNNGTVKLASETAPPTPPIVPNPPVDPDPTDPTDPTDPSPTDPPTPLYPAGALTFQIGTDGSYLSIISVDTQFSLGELNFDITNSDSAREIITKCDELLVKINNKRADIGANMNIMQSITQGNSITKENLSASNSRITDADIAKESANMVKNQILQNTASALLSQSQTMDGGLLLRLLGV